MMSVCWSSPICLREFLDSYIYLPLSSIVLFHFGLPLSHLSLCFYVLLFVWMDYSRGCFDDHKMLTFLFLFFLYLFTVYFHSRSLCFFCAHSTWNHFFPTWCTNGLLTIIYFVQTKQNEKKRRKEIELQTNSSQYICY